MEISDIIPLIVIVGSIIYSVISNINKKTKEQTAKTTLPGKTDVGFPEIFDDDNDDENYKIITSEKKEIQKETIKKPIQPKKKNTLPKTDSILIEDDESENFSFDFNDEAEMKKAIIYSEIFNRKA